MNQDESYYAGTPVVKPVFNPVPMSDDPRKDYTMPSIGELQKQVAGSYGGEQVSESPS